MNTETLRFFHSFFLLIFLSCLFVPSTLAASNQKSYTTATAKLSCVSKSVARSWHAPSLPEGDGSSMWIERYSQPFRINFYLVDLPDGAGYLKIELSDDGIVDKAYSTIGLMLEMNQYHSFKNMILRDESIRTVYGFSISKLGFSNPESKVIRNAPNKDWNGVVNLLELGVDEWSMDTMYFICSDKTASEYERFISKLRSALQKYE